ncbi:uncharacterized protein [Mytilus edulis]|uniref:uncharacterized protein n=1 Tax=Mytilus edulis TaxID=6550 RepID=UPI0039EF0418
MADIATILSRVSKVFQVRECCAADIHGIISETSMLINVYATKDGPYLSKAKQILNLNEETSSMRQRPGESFPAARRNLVAGLSVSLKNRFELDDIIQAMAIANFHTWPLPNSEADNTKEIEDFGDDHLPVILSHFETSLKNGAVDEIEAVLEWTALKSTLYASQSNEIQHLTWQRVNRMFPARYSNILAVMDLLLTIPGSSSECERGFRHMKSLKTTFRTCLSEDSLASQMCIKLHSPSIEAFDPVPAIRLWNAGGLRRPLYMDSKERNLIRVAKQSVNSNINERIATETESHHVDEEEDYLSVGAAADKEDLVQDDENGADSDHDDQFSDNEDYGNEGRVYRVMCREGLIEE